MKKLTLLASFILLSLTGCAHPLSSGQAFAVGASVPMGEEPDSSSANDANAPPEKVGPPQVVYRIDKDRYIGMEDYTNCNNGHLYYHNDAKNIKALIWKMSGGVFNYKGKIAWIATNDNMIAVPLVPDTYCSDRGCSSNLFSSPDGGKTFTDITFQRNSLYSVEGSRRYLIIVDNDAIYLKIKSSGGSYYNTIQYVPNENNEFYNRRQEQFEIDVNNEAEKSGIPRDVLNNENYMGFDGDLLMKKYHYKYDEVSEVDLKIAAIAENLRQRPRPKDPTATSSPAGDSSFYCDVSLIPK